MRCTKLRVEICSRHHWQIARKKTGMIFRRHEIILQKLYFCDKASPLPNKFTKLLINSPIQEETLQIGNKWDRSLVGDDSS